MPKHRTKDKAFPVGLFILISLTLLIGGVMWLRNFSMQPEYRFTVQYSVPDRVVEGVPVYYRGLQVGRVDEVSLARDQESTLVSIGITEDELALPENVQIFIRLEGITGQRYIEIRPPEEAARGVIEDGEIVQGTETFTWEKIQAQVARIVESRTIEKTLYASEKAMGELNNAALQWQDFVRQAGRATREIELAAAEIRGFARDTKGPIQESIPTLARGFEALGNNTANMGEALDSIRHASDRVGQTFETVNAQLVSSNLIPNLSETATQLGSGIDKFGAMMGMSKDPEMLREPLAAINRAARELTYAVQSLRPAPTPALAARLDQLASFSMLIQRRVETAQGVITGEDKEQIAEEAQSLAVFGEQISEAVRQLQSELVGEPRVPGVPERLLAIQAAGDNLGRQADRFGEQESSPFGDLGGLGGLTKIGSTVERVDCVAAQLSQILGQRFLGFKLFFGQPGEGFSDCADLEADPGQKEAEQPAMSKQVSEGGTEIP